VDTVGVAAALDALGVSAIWSAPLALGAGIISMHHGQFPAPAPATVALLDGASVTGTSATGETVTPTGAALLHAAGCRYGPMPAMRVAGSGYGAGSRDVPDRPNVLPALLGEPLDEAPGHALDVSPGHPAQEDAAAGGTETLIMVETTVDDVTGELLGNLPALVLGAGALDVWITAVTGKKGRPAHVITALCRPAAAGPVQARLLAETGSLGARRHPVQRHALPRQEAEVTVRGHRIRVKIGPHRAKPEHDDVAAAALATGLPRHVVAEQALRQLTGQVPEA
jgi:hypothetical protein